jgi:hypothetical protein
MVVRIPKEAQLKPYGKRMGKIRVVGAGLFGHVLVGDTVDAEEAFASAEPLVLHTFILFLSCRIENILYI